MKLMIAIVLAILAVVSAAYSPVPDRKLIKSDAQLGGALEGEGFGRKKFHPYSTPDRLFIQVGLHVIAHTWNVVIFQVIQTALLVVHLVAKHAFISGCE